MADIKINMPVYFLSYCWHKLRIVIFFSLTAGLPIWNRVYSRSWALLLELVEAGGTELYRERPREVKNSQLPSTNRPQVRTRKRERIKEHFINLLSCTYQTPIPWPHLSLARLVSMGPRAGASPSARWATNAREAEPWAGWIFTLNVDLLCALR